MPRYKVKQDVTSSKGAKFFKDEVVEGTPNAKLKDFVNVERKNDWGDTKNDLVLGFDIEKVDDSTPLTKPADFKGAMDASEKSDKTLSILSTIGGLGGLYFAYKKQKGFWGYVGYMVLGGIAGSLVAHVVNKFKAPKLKKTTSTDSTKKDTTTASTTTETPSTSGSNVKSPAKVDTSKMSKTEKIDLIIKNQRGSEPADADDENNTKAFLNTLNDAELSVWINLSKALKDEQINNAMAKSQEEGFKMVQSKYGITRKDAEIQMKKLSDFITKSFESAGFKVTEKQSTFSNFESSLDLDI
jgi:hypothetical protein